MASDPAHIGTAADTRAETLVEEYRAFLRDAVVRLCPRDMGLQFDDIVQDACVRLLKALRNEREIRDLASYAYRIAATTTIDAIRRARARREEQLRLEGEEDGEDRGSHAIPDAPERSPEREAERSELMRKIEAALARLPENRGRAVRLHLEGMTSAEIGELLEWTEPKARNLVYRGLADLREALRAEGIDYER
jgi:RNA polymerase sigma factor (sigma-70 family)